MKFWPFLRTIRKTFFHRFVYCFVGTIIMINPNELNADITYTSHGIVSMSTSDCICAGNSIKMVRGTLSLHRYTRSDQIIISCEKQNTPKRPPFSVESNMLPESATIFSLSNIRSRINPIFGRCNNSHRYAVRSFHPTLRGSFHSNFTCSFVSPVCHRLFRSI